MFADRKNLVIDLGESGRTLEFYLYDEDKIRFRYYGGHCGSCAEYDSTRSITAKELWDLIYELDAEQFTNNKSMEKVIKLRAKIKNLQSQLYDKKERVKELEKALATVKSLPV